MIKINHAGIFKNYYGEVTLKLQIEVCLDLSIYTQFSITYHKISFASIHLFGKQNQPIITFATPLST